MRLMLGVAALLMPVLVAAQTQDPSEHDRLAAALVAALPHSDHAPAPDPFLAERRDALTGKYPAKAERARALLADRQTCSDAKAKEGVSRMMLASAKSLSGDELRSLTAFYSGPDHARLETIKEGSPEWDALLARYPLKRFAAAMQQASGTMLDDVFAAEQACDAALTEALAKEGMSE